MPGAAPRPAPPRGRSPRRRRRRRPAVTPIHAGRGGDHVRPAGQVGVEELHVVRGRALLRAVDGGRTVRTRERVVDVARDHDPGLGERGVEAVELETGGVGPQVGAQGGQHPDAAVGARTATDPDDEVAAPRVEGRRPSALPDRCSRPSSAPALRPAGAPTRTRRPSRGRPSHGAGRTPSRRARRSAHSPRRRTARSRWPPPRRASRPRRRRPAGSRRPRRDARVVHRRPTPAPHRAPTASP